MRRAAILSFVLAGCTGYRSGPAWPRGHASAGDGGESLAARLPVEVAAIEASADDTPAPPAPTMPTVTEPAAAVPVAAAPAAPAEDPPTVEEITIEVDD